MTLTINRDDILAVYAGTRGCMCGCNGKYSYTEKHRKTAGERRGHAIDDDEISERDVTRILSRILASSKVEVMQGMGREIIYSVDEGNRTYAIYAVGFLKIDGVKVVLAS
jgi:hypothetical protein